MTELKCNRPPEGWHCNLPRGHDGPCPTYSDREVNLKEDGLLWLINRVVFHPRGFALAIDPDGSFILLGDGTEVWTFKADTDDEKFAAVETTLKKIAAL